VLTQKTNMGIQAREMPKVRMTSRETSDLIMIGTGAFSPVDGFMGKEDWERICREFAMSNGTFWPIPITLSVSDDEASGLKESNEVALIDGESGELMGSMMIDEKYTIISSTSVKRSTGRMIQGTAVLPR
jgi:sulfate adenylyltransferase